MSREAGTPFGPRDLPPQAAKLASQYSRMLQELPPVLAAFLLSQVRGYHWQFPAERRELEEQLRFLSVSRSEETQRILTGFRELPVPEKLMKNAWIAPEAFLQEFTAYLWQAHAMDQFRKCGEAYGTILTSVREQCASSSDRLVIVLIGQGARKQTTPVFEKLRRHGTYFANVPEADLVSEAVSVLEQRALRADGRYNCWFLDGATTAEIEGKPYARLSYDELRPVRESLAKSVKKMMSREGMGPEKIRSYMMALKPADLSGFLAGQDEVMRNFAVRVLCDGSGTQNLSTSFVQWSTREALRRAQPATLLARFAPRSRTVDFLDDSAQREALDAEGALIDADMGAYYAWLNLKRLPGSGRKSFLALAENGQGAVAIGPGMPAGTTATSQTDLRQIVAWMTT